jgi:hypothetical protein
MRGKKKEELLILNQDESVLVVYELSTHRWSGLVVSNDEVQFFLLTL